LVIIQTCLSTFTETSERAMTTKCIVYTRSDGGLAIVIPSPAYIAGWLAANADKTELDAIAHVQGKDVPPDALNVWVEEAANLPQSRAFRNCWREHETGGVKNIVVDMPLARAQKMAEIRAERNKRLAETDGLILRAKETGQAAQESRLALARQALRDLPATVGLDTLATPEALEAFQPNWPVME